MFATKSFLSATCHALLLMLALLAPAGNIYADTPKVRSVHAKQVIGQTAVVEETESDFAFPARVDTGATTSSLHVEDWKIEDEAAVMAENVGKTIRFQIKNGSGESDWLARKIVEISEVKTSEQAEWRYKVPVTLNCLDVKKCVLVSLNDRSHMTYPVLLGRNFLQGDFVVDVDLGKRADLGKGAALGKEIDLGKKVELGNDQTGKFVRVQKQVSFQEANVPGNGDSNRPPKQKEEPSQEAAR